ncbi:MAG: 50S ribosomal protein L4 [Chloroflexota bacterium]
MLVDIHKQDGSVLNQIELSDEVFGCAPNEHAMHLSVVVYLAHQRQGTHKTKGRGEVSGGGKKPWKQKGRGTARSGSSRSPVWVGGGTVHGPHPHRYNLKLPRKINRLAKKSALSLRLQEKNLTIVEDFLLTTIKTKDMAQILTNLKLDGRKILIVVPEKNDMVYLSARNIPNVEIYPVDQISTYDILKSKKLLLTKGAVDKLVDVLSN